MQVPPSCRAWEAAMLSTDDGKAILANLRAEECIPDSVRLRFFGGIESALKNDGVPMNFEEAREITLNVVKNDPSLACTGNTVPNGIFRQLFRLQKKSSFLMYLIPEEELGRLLKDSGLDYANPEDISLPELTALCDRYRGPKRLSAELGVVWVTDLEDRQGLLDDMRGLIDRLGLAHWDKEDTVVLLSYPRSVLEDHAVTLHVPRALDGIGIPEFRLEADCGADHGTTGPLTQEEEGLPEAVHRELTSQDVSVAVRAIK